MTLKDFSLLIQKFIGKPLTEREKLFLFESFRTKESIEDNPDALDERVVSLQAFVNSRKQSGSKKLNDLINMEEDDE